MTIRSLALAVLLTLSAVTAGWAQVTTQVNTELPTAQSVADTLTAPASPGVLAYGVMWNSASWDRLRGDATNGLLVNLGANNDVTVTGSVTTSNGGTFVVQENGAALTALQVIDNVVLVDDAAFTPGTSSVTAIGYMFDDVTPDSVNEGDIGIGRMSANRNQYVTIRDAAGNERGLNIDAAGALAAVITSTSITPGTAASNLGKAEDAAHTTADVGVLSLFVRADTAAASGANGDYVTPISDSTGRLWVNPGVIGVEDAAETAAGNLSMVGTVRRDSAASSAGTTGDNATLNTDGTGLLWVRIGASDVSSSGGTSVADDADITAGTTSFTPMGGFYQSTVTACTDGDGCMAGITAQRTLKVTLFNSSGSELTPSSDWTVGSAAGTAGPGGIATYSDFDGSALPTATNVDTEGEAVPVAASIKGVQYVMVVNEDGSLERGTSTTPMIVGDGAGALNVICDSGCSGSGASHTDDAAFTPGTDDGVPIFGEFDDTTPDSVNEGDAGVVRMSGNRNLYTTLRDAAGNERGANINASNELLVALSTVPSHAVTNAGTFAVQESGGALTALQIIDNPAGSATGGTAGTSSFLAGGIYNSTPPTLTNGQQAGLQLSSSGALIVTGAAGTTQYAEDAVHASGDQTVFVSGVRRDTTPSSSAGAAGDYAAFNVDGNGRLYVNATLYNSSGTELTQDTRGTHATTLGTITSVTGGILMGHASTATPTDVGADGDAAALWLTRNGALNIADGGGTITVDGTVTVTDGAGALNVICDSGCSGSGASHTDDAAFTPATDDGVPIFAVFDNVTPDSVDEGDAGALRMSANRNLFVTMRDAAGNERGLNIDAAGALAAVVTNAGTFAVQVDGSALTALQLLDDVVIADDAAFTVATTKLSASGFLIDETATDSGDEGDLVAARVTPDRRQYVVPSAHSVGGALSLKYTAAGTTEDEHQVKGSAGTLYSITATNTNAAARYLRCANQVAASTTPGTTTPIVDLAIPGATAGAGITFNFPVGVAFSTGLTCWTVTGAADTDVAEVAANEIKLLYSYF